MTRRTTTSGAKAYQRDDREHRVRPYADWHRTLDRGLFMTDVDFIEWRSRNGALVPVGVMEVTRVDCGKQVGSAYLSAIVQRFERDFQARAARHVATALGVEAHVVLFREDCSEFWVYNLMRGGEWRHYDPGEMHDFLRAL